MTHRNTHYFRWFVIFGVIAALASFVGKTGGVSNAEALWLLISGFLGMILGSSKIDNGKLARPYDTIVGIIFLVAGALGVLGAFGINLLSSVGSVNGLITSTSLFGLSVSFFPSLIHLFLGLASLDHASKLSK